MAEKWKFNTRYDLYTQITHEGEEIPPDPKGTLFESGTGLHDLSGVRLLSATIDTVKQLYHGKLKTKWMNRIVEAIENRVEFFSEGPVGPWHISGMGSRSGYRYKLQNNEKGLTILVKRFHAKVEDADTHIKIEVSPHRIRDQESVNNGVSSGLLQRDMDSIAKWLMEYPKPQGVAVHMAVDVQGWEPNKDFLDKFVTRTRAKRDFRGIQSVEFDGLSEVAAIYGDNETFMFGKASAMQMSIYRKDKEIIKHDKVDYFHRVWKEDSGGWFDPEKFVWRIELRLVHGIMREIGEGLGKEIESFEQAKPFLTDIWKYGLDRNRLMSTARYIDPFWQLIMEDVVYKRPAKGVVVRRVKKKDMSNAGRNVAMMIGNIVTLGARRQMKALEIVEMLEGMAIYSDITDYLDSKGLHHTHLLTMIERGVKLRRLLGKVA
ncbi:MAG: hypothetical protein HQL72_14930 [Magnetococcales bacterium]|nr:hypothetical protein [Magnetococcales bacterium]